MCVYVCVCVCDCVPMYWSLCVCVCVCVCVNEKIVLKMFFTNQEIVQSFKRR